MNSVVYTPKSKFHIDFGWQFAFTEALGCPRQRDLLQQVLYFSQKDGSTFTNAIGEQYQGMLINYDALAKNLGVSRRTLQTLLNQLANDGYIVKFKLNNNRILVQATDKAFNLLDAVHKESLAAKTSENDFEALSHNFDVITLPEPKSHARQNLHSLNLKLGKNYIALNSNRVKQEKTILDNPYQELKFVDQDKPNDCLTVSFFENDAANGKEHTKPQNTLITRPDDDLKEAAIAYLQSQCPDLSASTITKIVEDLIARFALNSHHEIVNAVLMTLGKITEDEAWDYHQQGVCAVVSSVEAETKENDSANNNAANLVNRFELSGATSHPETVASLQNSSTQINHESIIVSTRDEHHDKINDSKQAEQPNSNNQNVKKEISTTQTGGGGVMAYDNTTKFNHDQSIASNQDYHKNSDVNLTAEDIKMPVVEKEVLRKDWASLADQSFYEGVLPDCQKIALLAIIDYAKRKGVVIGSDAEIYRWLYHTVSHHERYYSRATNFKHLANILIKQLMNKRFERPSGFNAWEQRIQQQIGCSSMLQKE